ncbi:MAG TPA: TolC family protein [Thermoanaerobaculia bacterium]|nr:TolC family protein [Thermoanaerobaculia bacterium]
MNDRISVRRWGAPLASLALLTTLFPAVAGARTGGPEVRTEPALEATVPAPVRIVDGEVLLTLEETVALALERNLGLRVERFTRQQIRLGVEQAMGVYDLSLGGSASVSSDESPAASNLDGAEVQEQDRGTFGLGVSQLFASGGTGRIEWGNGRFKTNSQFAILNPSYSSGIDFSLSQPLLRGFGRSQTEFGIRIAEFQSDAARATFLQQVSTTIQNAENAYWNLVTAQANLRVAEESLRLAQQLHEDNEIRVDVGTLAPLELVQSEAGVATRQEEIIRARAAIGDAEDVLRYLIDIRNQAAWKLPIVAETPAETEPIAIDVEQGIETARQSRPELAAERINQSSREIESVYYRQRTRPRLDLTARYGFNGVGGDVVVRDPDGNVISSVPGGWDDAINQMLDADFAGWQVGLEFGYPLQNRSARARAVIADLALEQGRTVLERLEQIVEAEVRIAARGVDTSRQEIESARVSVRFSERNLEAERRKYENGLSTSFQILQVEEDLTAARSRLVNAITGYRRAIVEYDRSIGRLLEHSGVMVVD